MKTATSSAGAAPTVETGVKPRRGRKRQVAGGRRAARKPPSAAGLGKQGDPVANRRAAAILEVLAGEKLPSQAAGALGISVTHYYILERKALEGLLAACQPRPQGRAGPSDEEKLARLERELERSRRECRRQAALVRATQRAVGLPASTAPPSKSTSGGGGRSPSGGTSAQRTRRRRPRARALRAAAVLEKTRLCRKSRASYNHRYRQWTWQWT